MSTSDSTSSHDELERRLLILYATETGNAQDIGDKVARAARRLQFRSRIMSVDCYSLVCRLMKYISCLKPSLKWQENLIMEEIVIFIVSTTGSGIEPRSMTPLWNRLLSSRLPTDTFEDLSFAVFGLGDTSYEKFCWPAKLLSKRLKTLGATEICEHGEGDEQHPLGWAFQSVIIKRSFGHRFYRLDGAFEPWIDILLEAISRLFLIPDTILIGSTSKLPPPRVILNSLEGEVGLPSVYPSGSLSVTLNKNDRITAQDWNQDVRHIELESQQDIVYALSFACLDAAYFKAAIFLEISLSSILSRIQMRFKSSLSQSVGTKWQMNPCQSERNLKVRPITTRVLFLVKSCIQIKVFQPHFWIPSHLGCFLPITLILMLFQDGHFFSILKISLLMTWKRRD